MRSNAAAAAADTAAQQLTSRELLVLQLLARGIAPGQIAGFLNVPISAMWTLLRRAVQHLGARSLPEALEIATQRGLIP